MIKKFLWLALWVTAEFASSMTNGHAANEVISCYCDPNPTSDNIPKIAYTEHTGKVYIMCVDNATVACNLDHRHKKNTIFDVKFCSCKNGDRLSVSLDHDSPTKAQVIITCADGSPVQCTNK